MTQRLTADPEAFEVAFVPTVDDQVHALRDSIRRGRHRWRLMLVPLLLGFNVVTEVGRYGAAALFGTAGIALLVLVVGGAAYLAGPMFARWAFARRAGRDPGFLAPMAIRFAADGVRVKSAGGITKLPWSIVLRVRETTDLFLFDVGSNGSLYVPRRVLSGADASRLRKLLVARMGARARVHETNGR
ncbi:MAG TPA: YcxB family protein [Longimicrobiaceae bacterium]